MSHTISKVIKVLKSNPTYLLSYARQFYRFKRTELLVPLFIKKGRISLGKNVRMQALRCVYAEQPNAQITIYDHSILYEFAKVEAHQNGRIQIGESSILGDTKIFSRASITIGDRFLTSWNVLIQDFDPHPVNSELRGKQVFNMTQNFYPREVKLPLKEFHWDFSSAPISIGSDVWIGANATILKGAHIGDGCVVATGSVVVAGIYPAKSIIAGNPARVTKQLD